MAGYEKHIDTLAQYSTAEGIEKRDNDMTAIENEIREQVEKYFIAKRGAHATRKGRAKSYDLKGHDEVLDLTRMIARPLIKKMHPHLDDKAIDKMLEKNATAEMYINKFLGHGWYDAIVENFAKNNRNVMGQQFFRQLSANAAQNMADYEVNEAADYLHQTNEEGAREAIEAKVNEHTLKHGFRVRKGLKRKNLVTILKEAGQIDPHYIMDNRGHFAEHHK